MVMQDFYYHQKEHVLNHMGSECCLFLKQRLLEDLGTYIVHKGPSTNMMRTMDFFLEIIWEHGLGQALII